MNNDMIDISVEVQALNLEGIKKNLLEYVQKQAQIDIDGSVNNAAQSAESAETSAENAAQSALQASDCAEQASESLGNYYTKGQVDDLLGAKQDTLVSGTNIKTINSTSVLGSGNLALADQSLSNLNSTGQMVVDSANGTISNCILDIPQNIKLEFSNGMVTLKAGSVIVLTGDTYSTIITTQDITWSSSTQANTKQYLFITKYGFAGGLYGRSNLNKADSGPNLPADGSTYLTFFNTTDKIIYQWNPNNSEWESTTLCYPLGIIEIGENGNITGFAKDSNGNDMIFNGAGFIGHHAFVYPNVKALIPNGLNADGTLKSTPVTINSLYITELSNKGSNIYDYTVGLTSYSVQVNKYYIDKVKSLSEVTVAWLRYFVEDENGYYYNNTTAINYTSYVPLISYIYDGTTVTDFAIRQPVRTATVEMLQKSLGDVETLLAAI